MKEQWVRKSRGFFRRIGTLSLAAAVLFPVKEEDGYGA